MSIRAGEFPKKKNLYHGQNRVFGPKNASKKLGSLAPNFPPPEFGFAYLNKLGTASGGADRIDTYPIRISIQFLWIGTDRLSNPENLDRIGSDRQFFPLLSISNSGICLAWFFTKNPCNKCQNIGHCSIVWVESAHLCDTAKSILSNTFLVAKNLFWQIH